MFRAALRRGVRRRRPLAGDRDGRGRHLRLGRDSTYVLRPPFFDGLATTPAPVSDVDGARVLAMLGDSVTTDHISPAGSIGPSTPAGQYLIDHGVEPADFNSYGARRGQP